MLDRKTQERGSAVPVKPKSHLWLTAVIAVLALGVIGLGVWALSERNQADDLSADLTTAQSQVAELEADLNAAESHIADLEAQVAEGTDVVVVGGSALTERQQEMVALVTGPWIEAWEAADGEAVAALYTPDAVLYDIEGGEVVRVDDGTLQRFASSWPGIQLVSGMFVHGERIAVVLELEGIQVGCILEFTDFGELLIESNAAYNTVLGPNY